MEEKESPLFLLPLAVASNTNNTNILQNFKTSNGHQISQTKIPFCLVSRTDHESKLRFHRGGLYREKSEPQLRILKNENTKNSELSKIK